MDDEELGCPDTPERSPLAPQTKRRPPAGGTGQRPHDPSAQTPGEMSCSGRPGPSRRREGAFPRVDLDLLYDQGSFYRQSGDLSTECRATKDGSDLWPWRP